MEPRARAGKNVGKMSFSHGELAQLLYAHGDVKNPLPETARALDEILTDFIQSIAFEAARAGHYAGRQKLKFEDFEFSFRKNPLFMGKVQEVFEKKADIEKAKKAFNTDDVEIARDVVTDGGGGSGGGGRGGRGGGGSSRAPALPLLLRPEDELEDDDVIMEVIGGTAATPR